MKKQNITIVLCIVLILFFASCTKEAYQSVTVIRNCTGTYLRLDGKDYIVCNTEKVNSFPNGAAVTARFKNIKECNGSAKYAIVCYMAYANEGWIEIDDIK